jgi:mannosyltransferase
LSIPGLTGEMVDTGDARGLAQALERILSDREQARRMGKAARQRVLDQFSLAREAEGIGRVYAQLFAQS